MIKKVIYKEGEGDIELDIDNTELLGKRADMNDESGEQKLLYEKSGGIKGDEEQQLKQDLKRTGWKEAKKATDVKHICPVCGTRYWGRPNKAYCSTPCKEVAKKRRSRKRKRDIRDFKPHRGTAGEVYYMITVDGKEVITFVPAFNADTRARAKNYLDAIYPKDNVDNIMEQVKEVIKK